MRFLKQDGEIAYTSKICCYYVGMVIPMIEGFVCVEKVEEVAPEAVKEYGMELILPSLMKVNKLKDVEERDVPEHILEQFGLKEVDEPDICEDCGQSFKKINKNHLYCKKPGCGKEIK
jgi:hypothetical protein